MFGQSGELQSELEKQYEDQIINEDGTITKRERTIDLSVALFGGSSAIGGSAAAGKGRASKRGAKSSEFAKPLPRITMDDDGNLVDDTPVTGAGWGEDNDEYASASGFGIGDSLKPDLSDPTFIAAKAAAAKRIGGAGRLPPTASKEVGYANAEGGIDWLKLSSSGMPSVKIERGNVIASRPSEAMEHHSPVYQVKVNPHAHTYLSFPFCSLHHRLDSRRRSADWFACCLLLCSLRSRWLRLPMRPRTASRRFARRPTTSLPCSGTMHASKMAPCTCSARLCCPTRRAPPRAACELRTWSEIYSCCPEHSRSRTRKMSCIRSRMSPSRFVHTAHAHAFDNRRSLVAFSCLRAHTSVPLFSFCSFLTFTPR